MNTSEPSRTASTLPNRVILVLALLIAIGCSRDDASKTSSDAVRESRNQELRSAEGNTAAQNKELARYLIRNKHRQWDSPQELKCLEQLWDRESHWNHRAVNKRTGACGIPQSYPCNKMKGMGDEYGVDYRHNPWPQIAWGLQYIEKRYGSPCAAWKRFQRGSGY